MNINTSDIDKQCEVIQHYLLDSCRETLRGSEKKVSIMDEGRNTKQRRHYKNNYTHKRKDINDIVVNIFATQRKHENPRKYTLKKNIKIMKIFKIEMTCLIYTKRLKNWQVHNPLLYSRQ